MDGADRFIHTGIHQGTVFASMPNYGALPQSPTKTSSVADEETVLEDPSVSSDRPITFRDESELFLCGGALSSAAEAAIDIHYPHAIAADTPVLGKQTAVDAIPYPTRNHHIRL